MLLAEIQVQVLWHVPLIFLSLIQLFLFFGEVLGDPLQLLPIDEFIQLVLPEMDPIPNLRPRVDSHHLFPPKDVPILLAVYPQLLQMGSYFSSVKVVVRVDGVGCLAQRALPDVPVGFVDVYVDAHVGVFQFKNVFVVPLAFYLVDFLKFVPLGIGDVLAAYQFHIRLNSPLFFALSHFFKPHQKFSSHFVGVFLMMALRSHFDLTLIFPVPYLILDVVL